MIRTPEQIVERLRGRYGINEHEGRTTADLIERLQYERDQAQIRAEAAESELEAYRTAERKLADMLDDNGRKVS